MATAPSTAAAPASPFPAAGDAPGVPAARIDFERNYVARQQAQLRAVADSTRYANYLNMGFWGSGARTQDEAGERLACLVGETAGMSPDDTILDVGCGYGTEVLFWGSHFKPRHITAIDIDADILAAARTRAEAAGLGGLIDFRMASALDMPFADGTFDVVAAVESPMVFMSRDEFFRNACRVLRRGGRFVTSDLIGRNGRRLRHRTLSTDHVASLDDYARRLAAAGFTQVSVRSIRKDVIPGANRFRPGERKTFKGLARYLFRNYHASKFDYIIASATKPLA